MKKSELNETNENPLRSVIIILIQFNCVIRIIIIGSYCHYLSRV